MYVSPAEAEASGTQAVERALALDPNLAEAHLVQGQLLLAQGKYEEAERATLRALDLNPGSGYAHGQYGLLLQLLGRFDESVLEGRRAVELDPLSITNRHRLADRLFFSRDYDGSIVETEKVIELEPTDWYAWYNLGWCYSMTGRDQEAEDAFLKAREFNPDDPTVELGLAYAYARNGQQESALELIEGVDESSYDVSLVYYELGDVDEAFARLESVLAADPGQLARLKTDPSADALRRDSRFAEVLGRVGLE
jgi:tetratricopeptide (TPR) repeat protein